MPVSSTTKLTCPWDVSTRSVTRFRDGASPDGSVNLRALSSRSERARTAAFLLVRKGVSASFVSWTSRSTCAAVEMPETAAASAAICIAEMLSVLSMTVWLLASESSSILLTRLVIRPVLAVIWSLSSLREASSSSMSGEVRICVKPASRLSGVRISWEICWMKWVFMRDDSCARALASSRSM